MKFEPGDELESASERTFIVAIEPKAGAKRAQPQVVVVKALSVKKAKMAAFRKVAVKQHKNSTPDFWDIKSCEDANAEQTGPE